MAADLKYSSSIIPEIDLFTVEIKWVELLDPSVRAVRGERRLKLNQD